MERCYNSSCRNQIGNSVFYCCNPNNRYCQVCSQSHLCRICRNFPSKRIQTHKCKVCLSSYNLTACGCEILCQNCTLNYQSCHKCNKIYIPLNSHSTTQSHNPQPSVLNYNNPTINTNSYLDQSRKYDTHSSSRIEKSPKPSQPQKQYCSVCYKRYHLDQLFCNFNCGHSLCRNCLLNNSKKCMSAGCREVIDIESVSLFLKVRVCIECLVILPNDAVGDIDICANCISKARQAERAFQQEVQTKASTNVPDLQLHKNIENQETNEVTEENNINQQEMLIKVNRASQPIQKVAEAVQTIDSYLSPRGNYLKQLGISSNNNLLHPSRAQQDDRSSAGKSVARSRASSFTSEVKKRGRCIFCNLQYDSQFLFAFKNCKKPDRKRHKGCMCCLMKARTIKTPCSGCIKDQEEDLKKKFTYPEMSDAEKLKFSQDIRKKDLELCAGCQIVLTKNKVVKKQDKIYCKMCVTK